MLKSRKLFRAFLLLLAFMVIVSSNYAQSEFSSSGEAIAVSLAIPEGVTPPLQFSVDVQPQNGILLGTAPALTYQPNAGFVGTDSLVYSVIDSTGLVITNAINITVSPTGDVSIGGNNPPTAPVETLPERLAPSEATNALVALSGESINIELIQGREYGILGEPQHGYLTGQVPFVTYTAEPGYVGMDSFTYTFIDSEGRYRVVPMSVRVDSNAAIPLAGENVRVHFSGPTSVTVGDTFALQFRVTDQRNGATNSVFSGFADVTFNKDLVRVDSITYATKYQYLQRGTTNNTNGTINELGGVANAFTPNTNVTVATINLTALAAGDALFSTDAAEDALSETTIYGLDTDQRGSISYRTFTVVVNPPAPECTVGIDTIGIYRSSDRQWYMKNTNTPGASDFEFPYGDPSDKAITGDWDGDGDDTVGIFREGTFFIKNSNDAGNADISFAFGASTDIPVAGDWDGDCKDEVGIYRPSSGTWFLLFENESRAPDLNFQYGLANETPVSGDWDGDGTDTIGIFRASDRTWYLRNSNDSGDGEILIPYGDPAVDVPVTGDWDGDGDDTVGIYRANIGSWFLRNTNTAGNADISFGYGLTNETPVVGDWDGN